MASASSTNLSSGMPPGVPWLREIASDFHAVSVEIGDVESAAVCRDWVEYLTGLSSSGALLSVKSTQEQKTCVVVLNFRENDVFCNEDRVRIISHFYERLACERDAMLKARRMGYDWRKLCAEMALISNNDLLHKDIWWTRVRFEQYTYTPEEQEFIDNHPSYVVDAVF